MKNYTKKQLWDFVNRADTPEKCLIAEKWIREYAEKTKMSWDLFDELMMAVTWKYRDMKSNFMY